MTTARPTESSERPKHLPDARARQGGGARLTFRMSGGRDASLRIELVLVDAAGGAGAPVRTATSDSDGERMREVSWDVRPFQGQQARLVLVDQATGAWGHLNADDFLLWPE